ARRARRVGSEVQRGGHTADGVLEVHREVGRDVGAALGTHPATRTGRATGTEDTRQEVSQPAAHATEVGGVEREPARAAAETTHRTERTDLVVFLAGLLVTEHAVRRRDLLEPFLGGRVTRVLGGVQLAG